MQTGFVVQIEEINKGSSDC